MSDNPYEAPKSPPSPPESKPPAKRLLWPLLGVVVGAAIFGAYPELFPFWKSAQTRITIGGLLGSMVGSLAEHFIKRRRDARTAR
jgi:hypothetical protein